MSTIWSEIIRGRPIPLSRVWLQTELNDMELVIKITTRKLLVIETKVVIGWFKL